MKDLDLSAHLNEVFDDPELHREYAQNRVIVDAAVALNKALEASGMSQKQLAEQLGKTEGYVSQVLSGGTNMTLRTLGDFAYGLDCVVNVILTKDAARPAQHTKFIWSAPPVEAVEPVSDLAAENQYLLAA
jgi:transcriptional regulator with XRE-family HTH domain